MKSTQYQVAVIGAGPSGLAISTELKGLGVESVVVLERESVAGGIPRHCGHSPFGMREFHRILKGSEYSRRLFACALENGVELRLNTTVTEIGNNGELTLSTAQGRKLIKADRVVICTGARESPRSARMVSGSRPQGVMTTGALQSMIYLKKQRPFRHPVIVGSEMIAFSALLSCRHAGIKPVAMIEEKASPDYWKIASLLPRFLGTSFLMNSSLQEIHGQQRVSSINVKRPNGDIDNIGCDGVIFSGRFIGESSLAKMAGLDIDIDSNSPVVDAYGRCSNRNYFACGNIAYPLKTAGRCWHDGRLMAKHVKAALLGKLPDGVLLRQVNGDSSN